MVPNRILLGLILGATASAAAEADRPPGQEWSASFSAAGAVRLDRDGAGSAGRQSAFDSDLTFTARTPIRSGPWYWGWGVESQQFAFSATAGLPLTQLQDFCLPLTLEYYEGSEQAAALTVRPGQYFQRHPGSGSWDAPIEAAGGIPISAAWAGAAGVIYARFYHHPIPILGFVWTPSPQLRCEAVFPEPALIYTPRPGWEWRLDGELTGGGFQSQVFGVSTPVEYDDYRVTAGLTRRFRPGLKLTVSAGGEFLREFDFYRLGRRFQARPTGVFELGLTFLR